VLLRYHLKSGGKKGKNFMMAPAKRRSQNIGGSAIQLDRSGRTEVLDGLGKKVSRNACEIGAAGEWTKAIRKSIYNVV